MRVASVLTTFAVLIVASVMLLYVAVHG